MPIEVTMPKLSPTMETGVIAQWLKKVGDTVKEGDVLADIETDKATMQMKSYDDGTIVHIDHAAGDEVALGQRVLVLAKKGEDPKANRRQAGFRRSTKRAGGRQSEGRVRAAGAAPSPRIPPTTVSRRRPRTTSCRRRWPRQVQPARPQGGRRGPSVDIRQLSGTGPGGRIIRRDVEQYLQKKPQTAKATAAAPPASARAAPGGAPRSSPPPLAAERIPHSRMRKTIAQRMSQAKQTAPEIHLTADVRADRIVAARAEINKHLAAEGIKAGSNGCCCQAEMSTQGRSRPSELRSRQAALPSIPALRAWMPAVRYSTAVRIVTAVVSD